MQKQPRQDRHVHGDGEADHPFEEDDFGLDLEDGAVDPGEAVVMVGEGFGGLARLVLRRAGGDEGVVNFRDHCRHGSYRRSALGRE